MYRKTLREIGGFRNTLTEDMDMSFRLFEMRKKVAFVSGVAADQVPEKFPQYLRQQQRWNAGTGESIRGWKKHFHCKDAVLLAFILLLGLMAPISLGFLLLGLAVNPFFLSVPLIAFLLCLSAAANLGWRDVVCLPFIFFAFLFIHTFTLVYSKTRKPHGWYRTPKQ